MNKSKQIIDYYIKNKKYLILPPDSDKILNFYHIFTPKTFFVQNFRQLLNSIPSLTFPLVFKVISPLVIHKTKEKGVVFVYNKKEVKEKFFSLYSRFKEKELEGILVQEMIFKQREYILGGLEDKIFGKVIMFGLGGIWVEELNKVFFRIPPLTLNKAREMVYKLTKNKKEVDLFAKTILSFCKLFCQNQKIKEIDINPIVIYKNKVYALDSRIILKD